MALLWLRGRRHSNRFCNESIRYPIPSGDSAHQSDFALGLTWDKPDPAVRSAILEARRREARWKAKLEQLEGKHRELAAEHQYWWDVLKYFSPTREEWEAGYIHPLYAEAVKKQPYLEYLLDELEEEILEVKADRGRKGTTAGKHSPGGPGQTA